MEFPRIRVWVASGFVASILPVVFCLNTASAPSRGIGDGGPATNASLYDPTGLAVDANNLYIVESIGRRVRQVRLKTGIITTIAGGGKQCREEENASPHDGCLGNPEHVAVDSGGGVYVTDEGIAGIIKISTDRHSFSTLVSGTVSLSSDSSGGRTVGLEWPAGIAVASSGIVFFDDHTAQAVYRLSLPDDSLGIVAGTGKRGFKGDGGPATEAQLRFPDGLARDERGNLFVADYGNCRIQRIDSKTAIITTVTGTGEDRSTCERLPDSGATLDNPTDVDVDVNGNIFFVQPWRNRVQEFETATGKLSTIAGDGESGFNGDGGPATEAKLHNPGGIAVDKSGNIYISDSYNGRVRRVDRKTGRIMTIAGRGPILPDLML